MNKAPFIHFLSQWQSNQPQKGFSFLPKRACDVTKCEIARAIVLRKDHAVPVGFMVPRKSDLFQEDIFPESYAGVPSIDCSEYAAGKNGEIIKASMKPGAAGNSVKKVEFKAKKTYAQLEKELAAANKKIAELEAKLKN